MTQFFKAVRPDGTDFHTGKVQWAPPGRGHAGEWIVRHPTATAPGTYAWDYLSVSTALTDCTGMDWPCRLLTVEAVGDVIAPSHVLPNKRAGVTFRVTGELPAHEALGPQGVYVAALIWRARHLTHDEGRTLIPAYYAARDVVQRAAWSMDKESAWKTARDTAREAAWFAALDAARRAAWDSAWHSSQGAWDAATDAVGALVVRDLIATERYDTLTRAWRTTIGPIHPDDEPLKP